jgi:uncharacterized DUF497 family protein
MFYVTTITKTKVEFDQAKNEINERKHGVSLALADTIDWSLVWSSPDIRKDYGELREIGYAALNSRLYCVAFTQRGTAMRVISLRRAKNQEVIRYEQAVEAGA